MLRKLLILLIKFIPVIQMAGMLINNLLYFNDIYCLSYILDYLIGNSIITTFLLIVCSYIFNFCTWHRLIIIANFINITIASVDDVDASDETTFRRWVATMIGNGLPIDWYEIC